MAETGNENKRLRKFYDNLGTKYGVKGLPDYESFNGFMQDSDNRMKVYDSLKKKGHNVGTFEDFSRAVGTPIVTDNPTAEKVSPPSSVDNFGGNTIMDAEGNTHVAPSATYAQQQKAEPVTQTPVTNNADSTYMSRTPNADTTQVVGAGYAGAPKPNAQETQVESSPKGKGLIFKDAPQQEGFTSYNERMEQQTAPIKDMMQESANAEEIGGAKAEEWAQRETDYGKNVDMHNQLRDQYDKEEEELANAKAEFDAKYPKGWQPKTRAEQTAYERDADVINAQINLHNARAEELNKGAEDLTSERDALISHYGEMANMSSLRAQTLEGNVNNLMSDVQNEINASRKQAQDARGYKQPRGGYAALGGSLNRSMDTSKNLDATNEQTKYGIAERILGRVQNLMNESAAEKKEAGFTNYLENLGGEYFGWLGKSAGSVVEYLNAYRRGAADQIKDGAGFDFGIQDAAEMAFLQSAVKKADAIDKAVEKQAKGEKLTPEENALLKQGLTKADKAILDAASMEVAAAAIYKTGWGYIGGQVGVQMLPFILEIAINPLASAGEAAGNGIVRYALKKYGAKGFKGAVARGLSKVNPTIVSKATQIGTDLTVGGVGQAVTTGAANTYADYVRRKTGDIKYGIDENGDVVYGGHDEGMSTGKALASAVASQSLEYSTENYSEWVDGLGMSLANWATKGKAGKFAKATQKAMSAYANMHSKGFGKVIANVRKVGHIGGPFEEYTEEFVNNVGNGIIDYITEGKNNFTTEEGGVFNLGDNVETLLSVTMPQVFQGLIVGAVHQGHRGLRYVQQRRYNNAYNNAIKQASASFSKAEFNNEQVGIWDAIKSHIDNASQEDLAKEVTSLIIGDNFNADQKVAILNYAKALQAKRAEDLAETKLTEYKYDTDPDYQELSHRVNVTNNTIQSATTTDGDVIYLKTSDLESGSAMVYNPMTGEEMQIPSDRIVEMDEPLDANEEADKIEQARDMADTLNINDSANINGATYTIIDKTPETGMPIAEIENADGSVETREMTNEEVMAMSQQRDMAEQDAAENETLDPIEKMQKAINSGNAELLNVGMEELQTKIENTNDAKSLAELESMVARFGKDIVAQFKPIFKQKHKELDGEVSSESNSEEVETEEPSQKSRLQEIRDLVSTIGSEEELDNISIDDTLTDEEKQIASNIIEKRRTELRGMAENAPEIASVGSNGIEGNNVPQEQENAPTNENKGIEEEQTPTIPIKDGEKMYESVSADVTLADLMADFDNDADAVLSLVNEHIGDIEGRKPKSMSARVAKQKSLKYWNDVKDLLNKSNEQTSIEEVESEPVSEEPVTTKESVEESTQEEQTPVEEKVPDFSVDKAEDARERGYRMVNGERVDRQNPIENAVLGNTTETHFSTKDKVEGRVAVIDASMLQPSHTAQGKNPAHFLPEAQPKNRASGDSQSNSDLIAQNMNPALITETSTAFNGAPVVNSRGEVIQGNNRVIGLQKMHSGYAESAAKYKQYLLDNADRFGLDRAAIEKMGNPVLVNMVDVDDAEAIRLGQFDSHDMESGSGEVFKAKQTLTKMGSEKMQSFLNILLDDHGNPDMAIGEMVRRNAPTVIEWLAKNNFITQQQAANCYNNGALSTSATDALREMLNLQLFESGIDNLDVMFDTLPSAAQGAIMSIMARDNMVGKDKSLKLYIQRAIEAYHVAMQDEKFAEIGKDLDGAFGYLLSFANQTELFGEGTTLDPEKFDTFALRLAAMFKATSKVSLRNALNEYYDLVLGKSTGNLFEDNENTEPMSASEAIEKVFGVKTPVLSKTNNNNNYEDTELSGSNVRNDGYEQGEEGGQGSTSNVGRSEQDSQGERRSDSGRGNEGDSREGQTDEVADATTDETATESVEEEAEEPTAEATDNLLFTRRKLEDGEECKVERIFRESNAFNFTSGETIETIDDVANIFKQLENSSVENAFICFVKNGRPTVLHLGMGEFASTSINLPAIKLAYDRMQPDSIYFVHNHPSGALRASTNDIDCAKSIEKACGMQPTNLIIDTTRGEYAEFNAFSQTFKRDFAENPNAEIPVNLFSFDKQVFSTDYDASKNEFASNSNSVAAYISGHRLGERNKLGALIINKDGGIIGNVFIQEPEITEDNAQAVADKLYDDIVTFGGFNAVIFGTGEKNVKGVNIIKQRLTDGDITLLDCVDIHKDIKGDYTYDSFTARGVMDESTPSDSVETSVADESTPSTEEITDPRAIVPMPGETYSHLIKRINEAFKAGERLRKDHLNAAKQMLEERGEKDAKLIGQISDFIFGRMESAGVQMWFETQESAEEGNGEFQIVGEIGASNYAPARKALEKAKQMEAEGKTPAEIREKTLCERGADGKWRLEIPDTGIMPLPFDSIEGAYNYNDNSPLFQRIADGMVMADAMGADSNICKLKDLMFGSYARVLFKMYPELANIDVVVSNLGDNTPAALSVDAKTLYIWSPEKFRSNIIHEIQHAIQTYEGFSRGGDYGLFEETPESRKADRLYEEIRQTDKRLRAGGASDNGIERSSIARREGFSSREEMMKFIAKNSNYYKYIRIKGEVEARNVQKRVDTSRYWRQKHSLESTEDVKRPAQIDSPLDNIAEFHLSDGTVYGWANADGIHLTMEGLRPDTMIHEYSHLWMAAMKANNPALYESLMRLAKNSPIWNEVVEDRLYDLSSDDAILSEVFARYSGREGERKMLEVTRKAIQNGADYKEKARLAAEYDRLAQKMDKAWGWSTKFLGQDPTSFESMAEAADMLLMDIISGNNPNDGGYKPSGILKTPENGNPYFSDKNEYARGRAATSPSDVASAVSEWLNHRVDALQNFAVALEEAWTDYLSSVRDLQLDIVKETGNEVHDYENAYLHAMHLSSVNKEEQDTAKRTHIEPLINAMNTVITPLVKSYENSGMSNKEAREKAMDDLERYMIAKHGEERNKNIARRDAKAKAEKEFAPSIAQATAELKRADEDFNMGLISKSEHDAFENALNNLKAGQLIRENNLYAANRKNDKAGLRQTFEEEAKALGLWDDATDESTATLAELEKIARDFAQDFERNTGKVETDELWKMINALNALTLKKAFSSGNMSKEIYDQLKNQYQFYVPLKGWHDDTADEFYTYTGGDKFSNFQPTAKKATGRTSRAGDILATMIAMNSSAILQGNKNLVKQKLFTLVQNNPTKLVTVSKTWYEKTPSGGWVESHPKDANGNPTLDPVEVAEWEKKMEDMQKIGDARVGTGGLDISKNITLFQEREHEIRVNRGGREYVLYVNGAPNPAQALNGQLNIDANPEAWEKGFRWLNRFRAQNYTSRNPEFLIRNLQKDILDATAISLTKFGSDYVKQFEKNVLKLMPGSAIISKKNWNLGNVSESIDRCYGIFGLISKYKRGELDLSREIERHFQEFMENGGHTGYSQLWTIDEAQKDINSAIKRKTDDLRGESMRFVELANKKVELINAAFEDLTRFATYLTSRQSGKSILISVADAKDASTNFNKKGSGAMGNRLVRDLILFANPQLQGTARIYYRLVGKNIYGSNADLGIKPHQALRATMVFAGIAGIGAIMTNIDYLTGLFFGTGDDDELYGDSALGNSYWKLSPYRRHNYINIPGTMIGNGYFVGNMTPEFAAAYGTGAIIAEYALGYGHPDQSAKEIASQMSKFIPIIGDEDITKWHTWTDAGWDILMKLARSSGGGPVFEVMANEDFLGRKIHGYNGGLKKDSPEWEVWMQQKVIDEWTNGVLGAAGNVNNIEHVTRGYFGGLIEFPIHVVNMLFEDAELNDTPVKVFWASTANPTSKNNAVRTEFFYYKGKVDRLTQELKRKGYGNQAEQYRYVHEHLQDGIKYKYWEVYQKHSKAYNSRKIEDKIPIMKSAIKDWRETEEQD